MVVQFAQHNSSDDLSRTYMEVQDLISRQFEEMHSNLEQVVPRSIKVSQTFLFRTRPQGGILQAVISFDLPDPNWVLPTEPFGRIKLQRYLKRVSVPVPGLTIDWGKLNRIAADRIGQRQIVFKSEPRSKESWYATNDPYVAAVIREHIRRAGDMTHPRFGNEFRHMYEVNKGRYIMVGDHRFDDDAQGRAAAFAFSDATGIRDFRLIVDDGMRELEIDEIEQSPNSHFFDPGFDINQAMRELDDTSVSREHFERKISPETEEREQKLVQAAEEAKVSGSRGKGKKVKPAVLDDPIADFKAVMDAKIDPVEASGSPTMDLSSEVVPDSDLVAVNDPGSIEDLLNDFIEVNGADNETRVDSENIS